MLITYLKDTNLLKIEATDISTFISNINQYTGITINGTLDCSVSLFTTTYNTTQVINNASNFYIQSGILYIKPSFFNLVTYTDNIIKLSIIFNKSSSNSIIEGCIFVDITFKCKVALFLEALLHEEKEHNIEKISTTVHLLHYGLVNAGNCSCVCDDMCEAFIRLKELLGIKTNSEDCGC